MKRLFLFIAALCCVTMMQAETVYGDCGANMEWEFNTGSGALYLIGTGPMNNYFYAETPWKDYEGQIVSILKDSRSQYTRIGGYAFDNCISLETVELPNTVDTINIGAFSMCSYLSKVTLSNTLRLIGANAFAGDISLTSIALPTSLKGIGTQAFWNCAGLNMVTIPAYVEQIGAGAFSNCQNLEMINVEPNNKNYCSLSGVLFTKDQARLCGAPGRLEGEYTIPSTVTEIEKHAFSHCKKLTKIIFPTSVKWIYDNAFYGCKMQSMELNEGLLSLGMNVFSYCNELTSLTLPSTLEEIKGYCFSNCTKLTSFTCKATTPPTCSEAFNGFDQSACKLYVPQSALEVYKENEYWKKFGAILPIDQGIDQITQEPQTNSQKLIKDGQIYILRGSRTYTLTGQEVK